MPMVFHFSRNTPLFIKEWTPHNTLQYCLTIIFIIFLGIISKALSIYKSYWEYKQIALFKNLNNFDTCSCPASGPTTLRSQSDFKKQNRSIFPSFQYKNNLFRGFLQLLISIFSYLLMIVIMTMDIGYCIATLVGVFIGEFALSQYNRCYIEFSDSCS
ncbi:hypothetical protein PORY_000332 [Pneumocystis oryctolagi]|uniref:Uncharacterized protein n=1 Tax=Pneumocystis oryctolagi TaxID=42067 RepID=A0ACB7CGX4_9ASCO|nr:hypothetical protein PORY_000332 [Pneumocystis oryctolagi]